jgi:RNA polymerase sigma-70 factor (ECF subfamily)
VSSPLEELLRIEGGRVVATLIRLTGDMALAEEAVHDAVVAAIEQSRQGRQPANWAAWLTTTARNKALDRLRREATRAEREHSAVLLAAHDDAPGARAEEAVADDHLRLIFTCCHPALHPDSRVALALKVVAGLHTAEIARVFLVTESTMTRRITRAKDKIAAARIPYRVPDAHELPDRLPAVLTVISTIFTAGHHAASGRFDDRVDLALEGLRLARLMVELMPDEPECHGLLALLTATHARRAARVGVDGEMVLLADQDRARWDHDAIASASAIIDAAIRRRRVGPFQIQAAIACLHGLAPSLAETDWAQITELYAMLEQRQPTAAVRVNRAVAVAEVDGPDAALALLHDVKAGEVEHWHLWWATVSDLERRCGHLDAARAALGRALACAMNDSDRALLERRRAELAAAPASGGPRPADAPHTRSAP